MKHINLSLFLLLFIGNICMAQSRKNSILIGSGMLHIPNPSPHLYLDPRLSAFSFISYERKLSRKFGLGLQYAQWKNAYGGGNCSYEAVYALPQNPSNYKVDLINPIEREKFRFYDFSVNYALFDKKKHALSCNAGISVANGWNYYLVRVLEFPHPHYIEKHRVYSPLTNETYWGFSSNLRYNVLLFKQRLLLGVNVKYSYYHNEFSQFNYCLLTGFNF